ncbi:hypothetical protein PHYSODRAFT_339565 [Phytophthora sojae]|uniref:Uncharacterized protein n=1 Tax=Phytophthora sojae (strain P6497) TaxID=1094619 RepID=G5A794_PHYSP|nr:hypothetical protein PHYSODRAFT_339565 [Phytophthora sojae]EGZ09199.1 hypothetical protein PHYSODRAFT_339565 [Phytophthora sojae]|eukprot:XP_009535832.1 hypothetical protein PHYSODRAFT_339565 [Phytophthora sojae]
MGEDQKPRDEARELRLITWYLVDRFREAFASGFCCSVVRSTEVVNHALQTLTMRAIRLFDILSEGYAGELKCSARSQLEADLGALSKYFTAWNKSKRVAFSDDKLPGRAVVSGVEECKINEFVARNVQRERTTFAYADVNFFSRLDHADQADVKRLFSFYGKSFDAVKFRNEHRLRGQQYALGVFEVSHEVSVSERDKAPRGYRAYASDESLVDMEFIETTVSPWTLAEGAGIALDNKSNELSFSTDGCAEIEEIVLPHASYKCDVVMKVRHRAEAQIWAHPLTAALSFCTMASWDHTRKFDGSVDVLFHMTIPRELVKPAFVSVSVSSVMNLLLGNPVVRLKHEAKWMGVCPKSNKLRLVLQNEKDSAQTLFMLHPAGKRSFLLSTIPVGNVRVQWVSVRDGNLVADGHGKSKFSLYRSSTAYNDWVLQERKTSKLVVITRDSKSLRVKEGKRRAAPSFSFVRPMYGETEDFLARHG